MEIARQDSGAIYRQIGCLTAYNTPEQLKYKMRGDVLSLVLCLILVQTKKILKTITR